MQCLLTYMLPLELSMGDDSSYRQLKKLVAACKEENYGLCVQHVIMQVPGWCLCVQQVIMQVPVWCLCVQQVIMQIPVWCLCAQQVIMQVAVYRPYTLYLKLGSARQCHL